MSGFWRWLKWEFSRTIEVSGFIKFIIIERFTKGSLLILGGLSLLFLGATSQWTKLLQEIQEQINFNPNHHGLLSSLLHAAIDKMQLWSGGTEAMIAIAAILYGALEMVEGIGLVKRRRWAEYLVLLATVFFVPLEVDELLRRPTFIKAGLFAINVAIVVYLIWRKRLFLERLESEVSELSKDSA